MPNFSSLLLLVLLLPCFGQTAGKASQKPDYSKEAFVIEQSYSKVKFENDGSSVREDTSRVRIQSDAGVQRYGLLTFSYASATGSYDINYVRVRKPDGTIVVTPPDGIQDMPAQITREAPFYSDLREKHVAVKGLGIGDVLEFQTTDRVTKPLAPGQFWFEYSFARQSIFLEERLEVTVPRERVIRLKTSDFKPVISESGENRVYVWTSSHLTQEDDSKQAEKQQQIKTAWQSVRGRNPQPDVLISSFQSFEELGRWYGNLQAERVKPTPEIQAKAAELTKGLTTDDARIRALYKYVSQQFRYIGVAFGIGRFQPHSAANVLDNQYGDCKDKHTLLASLLGAAGIKAYPALISSLREIDSEMPSPVAFNHVITVVPQAGGLVWLDTTSEVGPYQYLLAPLRDKHALVVWDDKAPELLNTPADFPFASAQTFRMTARLGGNGTLEGNAEFSGRGDVEYLLRAAFRSVPLPQWKELAQRISYSFGFAGDVSDVTASSPENIDEPFRFSYKYTRKEFGDWTNHHTIAPSPAMSLPAIADDAPPPVPLWLGPPSDISFHSEMEIPRDYSIAPSGAIHLKYPFAEYESTYTFKNHVLTSERRLRTLVREVPPSASKDFKKFQKAVSDDYATFIPLNSSGDDIPRGANFSGTAVWQPAHDLPESSDPEANRLVEEARTAMGRKDIQGAISSLYRAVAADPNFTKARVTLGGVLLAANQIDAAMEAFNKAIAADPEHPVTRKLLGYALMASSKFDEAIPVWQEYIKIVPDDVDGHSNLGAALLRLKRYPEAASELETAVKLKPDLPYMQWQLASAYMHSDNKEKAEPVLRKLMEMDPGAGLLNNAAYEMADAGMQLPLAVEFAEKAVRVAEEDSSKIDLSKLQVSDLSHTGTVAAYWDTLGWTQNRLSQFDLAAKYLDAAWKISQEGGIASHLCQVYSQQHKTQAAIHMCRLALERLPMASGPGMYQASDDLNKTRALLDRLSPGASKRRETTGALDEVIQMRTFKLSRIVSGNETAEFFVLLESDPTTMAFKPKDTKFIKGSDKLKSAGKTIMTINFRLPTPDTFPTRVVRRGIFGCYQYSGCEFVLLDPSSGHSLD